MNGLSMMGKLSAITAILIFLTALQPLSASALEPVFEIRAKDGHTIGDAPFQKLSAGMDPENTVRMGFELRPGMMIGFNSKYGLGLVLEF
jgi:hypothetical protein